MLSSVHDGSLEARRDALRRALATVGDFRQGSLTPRYIHQYGGWMGMTRRRQWLPCSGWCWEAIEMAPTAPDTMLYTAPAMDVRKLSTGGKR